MSYDPQDMPWDFPPVLYLLPTNAKTFGESLSAPRRKYVLADEPDPRDEVIRLMMEALDHAGNCLFQNNISNEVMWACEAALAFAKEQMK